VPPPKRRRLAVLSVILSVLEVIDGDDSGDEECIVTGDYWGGGVVKRVDRQPRGRVETVSYRVDEALSEWVQMPSNEFRKRMRVLPVVLIEIVNVLGPVVDDIMWERKLARRARARLHGLPDGKGASHMKRVRPDALRCQDRIVIALYSLGEKSQTERTGWAFRASPSTTRICIDVFLAAVCRRWHGKITFAGREGGSVAENLNMLGDWAADTKTMPG
jgi:hypothetical protein